jgi:hypothetical protein
VHAGCPQDAFKPLADFTLNDSLWSWKITSATMRLLQRKETSPSLSSVFAYEQTLPCLLLQTSFRMDRFQLQQTPALKILNPHDQSLSQIVRQRERRPIIGFTYGTDVAASKDCSNVFQLWYISSFY